MFKRNGRPFKFGPRSKEKRMDTTNDHGEEKDSFAEPPVVRGGSGYRTTSTDGVANMISNGTRDKMTRDEEFGIKVESETNSNHITPPKQSQKPSRLQSPQAIPQRISSLSSDSPTTKLSPTFDRVQDYDDEDEVAETIETSHDNLSPLQAKGYIDAKDSLDVVVDDDPRSYNVILPAPEDDDTVPFSLETRSEQIFSKEHLRAIFKEPSHLIKFSTFLGKHQLDAVPMLLYYLDSLKALETIKYSNAIADTLSPVPGYEFTKSTAPKTVNLELEEKARMAFEALAKEALPAYVTHIFTQKVSLTVMKRVTGTLPPHLRDKSDGLAEVFCLSDPNRKDNPLVLASEEFHRTTQYGVDYAMGRNCRFLQGPRTNKDSTRRIKEALAAGRELSETFMNYRRDGSPFLNLLMVAPLRDNRGKLRYFLGAQVDVSGLAKDCSDLEALRNISATKSTGDEEQDKSETGPNERARDSLQELSEMFSATELATIKNSGGRMHREVVDDPALNRANSALGQNRPRLLLKEPSSGDEKEGQKSKQPSRIHGRLKGVYQHYLLVRPYPSLRILFTSPSLRYPGILQSPLMNRIGSSERVRKELLSAMEEGRGVTAKVKWLSLNPSSPNQKQSSADADASSNHPVGRNRWLHCTPLLSATGEVGVWMIVLVDETDSYTGRTGANKFKAAPPVAPWTAVAGGLLSSDRQRQERERIQKLKEKESLISLNASMTGSVSIEDPNIDESVEGDFKVI